MPADEEPISTGITQVGATASGDRIVHVVVSTDGTVVRWWVYRLGAMIRYQWREDLVTTGSNIVGGMVFAPVGHLVIVGNDTNTNFNGTSPIALGAVGATDGSSGTNMCRVNATNLAVGGGGEVYFGTGTATTFAVPAPELQAAAPIVPLVCASTTVNFRGKLGARIDAWYPYCNGIAQGDTFGALQFVALGLNLVPWDGASAVVLS